MKRSGVVSEVVAVGVGLLMVAAGTNAQTFRSGAAYQLSETPQDALDVLITADVGSPSGPPDGMPDLITLGQNMRVSVLVGKPNGTFGSAVAASRPLQHIPTAAVVGDFNGDHAPDLLVADSDGNITFVKGNNNGSFGTSTPSSPIAVGNTLSAILAADLNGDGQLDALVLDSGEPGAGSVHVLLGQGNGGFTAGPTAPTDIGSTAMALGDFDKDGTPDLAVANSLAGNVTILHGTGGGNFTTLQTIKLGVTPLPNQIAMAAGDLNGDGRLDLVLTFDSTDQVAVFDGQSGGTFAAPRTFASGTMGGSPDAVALADMNGDGKLDVVVANNRSADAAILLGDGHGNLAAPRAFVADQEPLALVVADFNGDRIPDVATVNRQEQNAADITVLLGEGDGSLAGVEDVAVAGSPSTLAASDADNDALADLFVGSGGGAVSVFRSVAPDGFSTPLVAEAQGQVAAVALADFDGDGRLDVAALSKPAMATSGSVSVFLGSPAGGFGARQDYPIAIDGADLIAGDWNGDGRADLAVVGASGGNGSVQILLAQANGHFASPQSFAVGTNPTAIDFGDLNKDGKPDLVVGDGAQVYTLLGNGNGSFQAAATVAAAGVGANAVAVADFDHDGNNDIAFVPSQITNGAVVVLYGDGRGNFGANGPALSLPGSGVAAMLAVRDINGDGFPDLVVPDEVGNQVALFLNGASTLPRIFTAPQVTTVNRMPTVAVAADFDGDGRYDAAALDTGAAATVSVLTNVQATAVLRGDANGDGKVSAADAVALVRTLGAGGDVRLEQARQSGANMLSAALDANGDGVVSRPDLLATAARLFPRL